MSKIFLLLILLIAGCDASENNAVSDVYLTTKAGLAQKTGEITFADTPQGLLVNVDLQSLPQGKHGFHIHEFPDCNAMADASGIMQPALKAGGHYDPDKTGKHLGPNAPKGHKGDLPILSVSKDGKVKTSFIMKNLKVEEIKNRSIIIHAGSDNYKDSPLPLGGGGARIACGVIK